MNKPTKAFTKDQHDLYKKCNIIARTNQGVMLKTIEACYTVRVQELHVIEGLTWAQWKAKYVPDINPESIDRMVRREGEKLPLRTIGENILKRTLTKVVEVLPTGQRAVTNTEIKHALSPITETTVKEAAKEIKAAKVVVVDEDGTPVPKEIISIWNRKHEVQVFMTRVSELKCEIAKLRKSGDVLFGRVTENCINKLELVYSELSAAHPEVVCGSCEGIDPNRSTCGTCKGTGFQSKQDYKLLTPVEYREMRKARQKDVAPRLPAAVSRLHP